ncbi:hypothetical protein BC826DRAFT_512344 [Russula brevipes]|nr:hypothetical protein BC826DRAFT_512344 [Russula brevipes]
MSSMVAQRRRTTTIRITILMAVVTTRTPKRRTQTVEREADARPASPQFEDADWDSRYDATRDRCQSAQEAHTQHMSTNKLVTEFNETSGRHVDAHARHDRQSAEYADIVQRVPPEPPPLDSTIKAKIPPQSANPNRPADCPDHTGVRVITHDAHQGNRCDPWLVPFAPASDFGDAISTGAEQQRNATILGRSSAECAESCQAPRAPRAALDDLRHDNERLCDHTFRQRKVACRHGSSPSPSRGLSRPASSTREDPVAGPLQPTHPFTLRAVTIPWSSVLPPAAPVDASGNTPFHTPGDAPPASSLTIDDTGDTPVAAFGNTPVKAHGDAPVPPTPAAFAPSPFAPFGGFPSVLPVLCQGPVELLLTAVGSSQLDASGDFDAHAQRTLTTREPCFPIPPRGVIIRGVKVSQFPSNDAAVTSFPRRSVAPHGPRAHRADGVPALGAEGGLLSRLSATPSGSRALPSAPDGFTPGAAPFPSDDDLSPRTDDLSLPPRGLLLGGRDGVLMPDSDSTNPTVRKNFFTHPNQGDYTAVLTNCLRFVPTELRGEVHIRALKRWRRLRREHEQNEIPALEHKYKYRGILRIDRGCSTMHVEGATATLMAAPLTKKHTTRESLLRATAKMRCVPGRYAKMFTQLEIAIASTNPVGARAARRAQPQPPPDHHDPEDDADLNYQGEYVDVSLDDTPMDDDDVRVGLAYKAAPDNTPRSSLNASASTPPRLYIVYVGHPCIKFLQCMPLRNSLYYKTPLRCFEGEDVRQPATKLPYRDVGHCTQPRPMGTCPCEAGTRSLSHTYNRGNGARPRPPEGNIRVRLWDDAGANSHGNGIVEYL